MISDSNDTIILELNLIASDIVKEDLFKQLQELNKTKLSLVNDIFKKKTELKLNYKPTYEKDIFERQINQRVLSKFLDKSSNKVESMRKEYLIKSSLVKSTKNNSVKVNYLDSSNLKQYHTIESTNKFTETIQSESNHHKLNNYLTINLTNEGNSNITNSNTDLPLVIKGKKESAISLKKENGTIKRSNKHDLTKEKIAELFSLTGRDPNKSKSNNTFNLIESIENNKNRKKENFQIRENSKRKILMFKTENFNLPLVSQLK